jgi:cephalosporin-C deacetylase-like acetyl esterase
MSGIKPKKRLIGVLFCSLFLFIFNFTNCSSTDGKPPQAPVSTNPTVPNPEVLNLEVLGNGTYSIINLDYPVKLLKIKSNLNSEPVFAEFVSACSSKCPLVIISDPYYGIDWTGDSLDSKWALRPNASTGYSFADEDGPNYQLNTTIGTVSYGLKNITEIAELGGLFLPNNISIMIVHSRFYRGRNLKNYIADFVRAVNATPLLAEVNTDRIGFLGTSLGGFVALNSALESQIKPKTLVLQSPLIDLAAQLNYIIQLPNLIHSNEELLLEYQKFFDSYVRRIYDFTGGAESENTRAYDPYRPAQLAPRISVPTLLLNDDWDTLIPMATARQLAQLNPTSIFPIWFQHATNINYNTFSMDHGQSSEGQNYTNTWPQYHLFMYRYLLNPSDPVTLYYHYTDLTMAYVQFHDAQLRGQDVGWLKSQLLNYCRPNLNMVDISGSGINVTGTYYLASIIQHIWNVTKSENEICSYLETASWPL